MGKSKSGCRSHLLFVATSRYTGGAEQSLLRLITHLNLKYECVLACPATSENQDFRNKAQAVCRVVKFDTREPKDSSGIRLHWGHFLGGCWKSVLLYWRTKPDVIVFFLHLPLVAAAPRFIAALFRWPAILSFRLVVGGLRVGPRRIRLLNWEKKRAQTWVAVSEDNRRLLCQDMHLGSDKIQVILNGIPALSDSVSPSGTAALELRRRLGLPEDRTIFLFAGRLTPIKGCRELVMAAAMLWKLHPQALCVMLGDGPDRSTLQEILEVRKAEPAVLLAGSQSNVAEYLRAADVYVHPSHAEGLSNSILEAMQLGLPIIAANCSSMPELVTDQVEGLLVPKADSAALCHAMQRLLLDPDLRGRMGKAAAEKVKAFSLESTFASWDKLIVRKLAKSNRE